METEMEVNTKCSTSLWDRQEMKWNKQPGTTTSTSASITLYPHKHPSMINPTNLTLDKIWHKSLRCWQRLNQKQKPVSYLHVDPFEFACPENCSPQLLFCFEEHQCVLPLHLDSVLLQKQHLFISKLVKQRKPAKSYLCHIFK